MPDTDGFWSLRFVTIQLPHIEDQTRGDAGKTLPTIGKARARVRSEMRGNTMGFDFRIQLDRAMNAQTWIKAKLGQYAPIPLRLIVGFGFLAHGYSKIVHGPEHFINILHSIGVPAPELMGWATILIELVGGLAVLVGALVPLAILPMAAVLLVAILTVHLPYGFLSIKLQAFTVAGAQFGPPGYELDLLYLACLTTLALGGPGPFSVDSTLSRHGARRKQEAKASLSAS